MTYKKIKNISLKSSYFLLIAIILSIYIFIIISQDEESHLFAFLNQTVTLFYFPTEYSEPYKCLFALLFPQERVCKSRCIPFYNIMGSNDIHLCLLHTLEASYHSPILLWMGLHGLVILFAFIGMGPVIPGADESQEDSVLFCVSTILPNAAQEMEC